jgi:demethylmenaquinone methyltransferase / 2-methoxy-6-polyprenyl-1,4-benzoquinol methylase
MIIISHLLNRGYQGALKFDDIAQRYDFLNHLLSAGQDYYWRRAMVRALAPSPGELILDLASGTGDSARGIAKKGVDVVGIDISFNMLSLAKQKLRRMQYRVVQGSGYSMPFRTETFDGAVCAFGIRNMHETADAIREIFRVMKKGGRMVFLEFSMPRGIIRRPYLFYLRKVLPAAASLFSSREEYDYLGDSIEKFYSPETFAQLLMDAGFSRCEKTGLSLGCVYIHKAYKGEQ